MLFFLCSNYVFRVKEAGKLQGDTRRHNISGNGYNEISGVTDRGRCGRGVSATGGGDGDVKNRWRERIIVQCCQENLLSGRN